jgi:hypothetical protein
LFAILWKTNLFGHHFLAFINGRGSQICKTIIIIIKRYKHSESQIKVPIPWTILSQSLCRLNCHDKSLLEISERMTEVPEVTLLYVEILGTKMAFEKKVPDKDTNHLEYISALECLQICR